MTATALAAPHRRNLALGWGVPVALWALSRLLIAGVAAETQWLQPAHGLLARSDWPIRLLFHWDSGYFLAIAGQGYAGRGETLQAFFPGYPVLSRALALPFEPTGPSDELLMMTMCILTQLAALCAAMLIWSLARREHSPAAATIAVALVLFGPYALFLAASYSEALFLAFAVAAWLLARRRLWWGAGLAAAAASFTRVNGLFLVAALVVMYLVERRHEGRRVIGAGLIPLLAGALGAGLYWLYLLLLTGSPTAWNQAQAAGWQRGVQWPWLTFYQTAGRMLFATTWDRRVQYGLDIVLAAALVIAIIWFVRTRRWPEVVLLGLTAVSLMTSFSYLSLARNTATLFPIALALGAAAMSSRRGRWVAIVVGVLGVLILCFTTHQFTLDLWAD